MTPPLIGVTTYGRDEGGRFELPAQYIDAVRRAGGIPMLIAPGEQQLLRVLDWLDGLVLSGGGDIDPARYGGGHHHAIYNVDHERDESEFYIAREAIERRLPTLAICRGMQVVNVAYGGSLIAHLPDAVGERVAHRVAPRNPVPHSVTLDPDSKLAAILGETEFSCMSWHHQALDKIPAGFEVVARAPDGVVEAVEHRDYPWLLSVQWHPEITAAQDPIQQRLFDAVVQLAGERS